MRSVYTTYACISELMYTDVNLYLNICIKRTQDIYNPIGVYIRSFYVLSLCAIVVCSTKYPGHRHDIR